MTLHVLVKARHCLPLPRFLPVQMETSVQTSPARTAPCVPTAWEATTASASRASRASTVKTVRGRCRHCLSMVLFCHRVTALTSFCVSAVQTKRCAPWSRRRAALSSVSQATPLTSAPALGDGGSATRTETLVCLQVHPFVLSNLGIYDFWFTAV